MDRLLSWQEIPNPTRVPTSVSVFGFQHTLKSAFSSKPLAQCRGLQLPGCRDVLGLLGFNALRFRITKYSLINFLDFFFSQLANISVYFRRNQSSSFLYIFYFHLYLKHDLKKKKQKSFSNFFFFFFLRHIKEVYLSFHYLGKQSSSCFLLTNILLHKQCEHFLSNCSTIRKRNQARNKTNPVQYFLQELELQPAWRQPGL